MEEDPEQMGEQGMEAAEEGMEGMEGEGRVFYGVSITAGARGTTPM